MVIPSILAISAICSLIPESAIFLEEAWFPPAEEKSPTHFIVTYPTLTRNDLEGQWQQLFFQKMIQDELCHCSHIQLTSPPSASSITFNSPTDKTAQVKDELLSRLEKIKGEGFSYELLEKTKGEAKSLLGTLSENEEEIIAKIRLSDFFSATYLLSLEDKNAAAPLLAMLQKGTMGYALEFSNLPIHEHEKVLIYKIITTMAKKNPIQLALKKSSLEKKGKKIHHIHPFRFLGYVFSEPELKQSMHEIKKNHFKWNGFLDGYSKKMRNEATQHNLMPYVESFAGFLRVDSNEVAKFIQKKDYEGLVRFLLP